MRPDTRTRSRAAAAAVVLAVGASLGGCVRMPLAPPQASLANLQLARQALPQPLQVGSFQLGAGLPPSVDQGISARGSVMTSPYGDSMSAYLREVLVTELRAAGRLDPLSDRVVSGELTRSELDASVGTGRGALAARIRLHVAGQARYDRELSVSHEWPSAFVGADAIPTAFYEYTHLMHKLVGQLLQDPDFQSALK